MERIHTKKSIPDIFIFKYKLSKIDIYIETMATVEVPAQCTADHRACHL